MKKKAVVLCLLGAMVLGTCTVSAANGTRNISATFRNIKIVVDGQQLTTNAEPFIYNGTTYLPIRAVGEAVGKEVTWNGNTNTVYLGEVPASAQQPVGTQQPATPAPAPAATANLPLLFEYVGISGNDEFNNLVQSGGLDANAIAEVYLYIMDAAPELAKDAYAEAQTAFTYFVNDSNYADAKGTLESYYKMFVMPRS